MPANTNVSLKTNVLAVDNDPLLLELLVAYLEDMGYDVVATSSPVRGLAHINEANVDVLITDIQMPEIDGLELARRAREAQPSLPIIFVSGYLASRDRCPSKSVLISKPYTRQQLANGIQQVLRDRPS